MGVLCKAQCFQVRSPANLLMVGTSWGFISATLPFMRRRVRSSDERPHVLMSPKLVPNLCKACACLGQASPEYNKGPSLPREGREESYLLIGTLGGHLQLHSSDAQLPPLPSQSRMQERAMLQSCMQERAMLAGTAERSLTSSSAPPQGIYSCTAAMRSCCTGSACMPRLSPPSRCAARACRPAVMTPLRTSPSALRTL